MTSMVEKQAKNELLLVVGRWASIMLVPIVLAIGQWTVSTLSEVQNQVTDLRTKDIVELRVQAAKIEGTTTVLSGRLEDNMRTTNSRLDQQSEWIRKQGDKVDDMQRRLYPMGVPQPPR